MGQFGKQGKRATAKYTDFVRAGVGLPSIWEGLQHQIYLGGEQFIQQHQQAMEKLESPDEVPMLQRRPMAKPLSYYEKQFKDQGQAMTAAYRSGAFTLKEIGDHHGKHSSTISRIIKCYV